MVPIPVPREREPTLWQFRHRGYGAPVPLPGAPLIFKIMQIIHPGAALRKSRGSVSRASSLQLVDKRRLPDEENNESD